MCDHVEVTVYSKIACYATRFEPEEWDEWAECDECGEVMDVTDIPEDADVSYEPADDYGQEWDYDL